MGVWRVFVSHTSELARYPVSRSYVSAAEAAVTRAGEAVGDMSYFTARDQRPAEYCRENVEAADVYVAIVGFRYGSLVPDVDPISFTELEFDVATARGIPRLIFCLDEESHDLGLPGKAFNDHENGLLQTSFRRRLQQPSEGLTLCSVESTSQLETALYQSLVELRRSTERAVGRPDTRPRDQPAPDPRIPTDVLRSYFTRLSQQYRRLDLEALTPAQRDEQTHIALRNVFVPQDVREKPPPVELSKELWRRLESGGEIRRDDLPEGIDRTAFEAARKVYSATPRRPVLDVLTGTDRLLVLLGDPGAGKSSLARFMIMQSIEEQAADSAVTIPLLIELRALTQSRHRLDAFVDYIDHVARTDGLGLPAEYLVPYLRSGGDVLVIFDGLDEIFDPQERDAIARRIAGFAVEYPRARLVVTSRVIGYRRNILTDAGFAHFTIQDFDKDQTGQFLEKWYTVAFGEHDGKASERRDRLTAAIAGSRPIEELASNPLLLTILAIMGKSQELPRERWEVYDHAVSVLVEHWDVNRYLRDRRVDAEFIGKEDKRELLRRIANRMQSGRRGLAGNFIHHDDLVQEIEGYLRDRYQRDPANAKIIAEAMINQFRERNFILSRYGGEVYGFVHRAFLEFFCADFIRRRFERTREIDVEELRNDVFGRHWDDDSWREVLLLIAGMLDERFVTDIVESLLVDTYFPWPPHFGDRPPRNVLLAVLCLAEMRNRRVGTSVARLLLRQVIELIERSGGRDQSADEFVGDELLPAVGAVGTGWPEREPALVWYLATGAGLTRTPACRFASRFVAYLFPDRAEVVALLHARALLMDDWRLRDAAVVALGQGSAVEAPSREVLRRCAEKDLEAVVRWRAMDAFVGCAPKGSELGDWLEKRAQLDSVGFVRALAVEKLADAHSESSTLEPLLRRIAVEDPESIVRDAAAAEFAKRAGRSSDAMAWLRARLSGDAGWEIRHAAVSSGRVDDPDSAGLLTQLQSFAVTDLHWRVRAEAVRVVAKQWRNHPGVLGWVRARAERDHHPSVREAAIEATVASWRDEDSTEAWLGSRLEHEPDMAARLAVTRVLVATLQATANNVDMLRTIAESDPSPEIRSVIVKGIADTEASGAATFPWLRRRTAEDPDPGVRRDALTAVVRVWKDDPATRSWLIDRGSADVDSEVRIAALVAVARGWPADPSVWPWLRERAKEDRDWSVRRAAVVELAQLGALRRESLLPWLTSCAVDDPDQDVREAALVAVSQRWSDDANVYAWLLTRAVVDVDDDVRKAALLAITRGWRNEPQTLPLVQDRARHDPHPAVRKAAVLAVAEGWHEDPQTVPWLLRLSEAEDRQAAATAVNVLGRLCFDNVEVAASLRKSAVENRWGDARKLAIQSILVHSELTPAVAASLAQQVADERYFNPRRYALFALVQGWPDSQICVRAVRRAAIDDIAPATRALAVASLESLAPPRVAGLLQEIAEHDDAAIVRAAAVGSLVRIRPSAVALRGWLWRRLDDRSARVRAAALLGLSRHWSRDQGTLRQFLVVAQDHVRQDVRHQAVLALETLRHDDPDSLVRAANQRRSRRSSRRDAPEQAPSEIAALPMRELRRCYRVRTWQDRRRIVAAVVADRSEDPEARAWIFGLVDEERDWAVRSAAVEGIGVAWHHLAGTAKWLMARATTDRSVRVRATAVRATARWWSGDPTVSSWLRTVALADQQPYVRQVTLATIATYRDARVEVLSLLRDRATQDPNEWVRCVAIRYLSRLGSADPRTWEILAAVAENDVYDQVRRLSLTLLTECAAPDGSATPVLLRRHSEKSDRPIVRQGALDALTRDFADSPDLLEFARGRAVVDASKKARLAAVRAVLKCSRGDIEATGEWLKERAFLDSDSDLRQMAVRWVSRNLAGSPDTLPWLRDCAEFDAYNSSRAAAIAAVGRGWADLPETSPWLRSLTSGTASMVRRSAALTIAACWPSHPECLPLLQHLSVYDQAANVRSVTAWAIAVGWRRDAETMPWLRFVAAQEATDSARLALAWALDGRPDIAFWLTYGLDHHGAELAAMEGRYQIAPRQELSTFAR